MVTFRYKILIGLMIAALAAGGWAAQIPWLSPQAHEPPAGCHEHGGKKMPVQGQDHSCCLIGHEVVILRASHVVQPVTQCGRNDLVTGPSRITAIFRNVEPSPINSADCPCAAPLRI